MEKSNINNSTKRDLIILSGFFLIMYFFRPFLVGFYADDWSYIANFEYVLGYKFAPFSTDLFAYYFNCFANRPITGLTYYLAHSICGTGNPVAWQFFVMSLVYLCSVTFYFFAKRLAELVGGGRRFALFSALLFLAVPWQSANFMWISLAMSLPSVIFFNLSSVYLLKSKLSDWKMISISSVFFMLSVFTYESFYFQSFFVLGMLFLLNRDVPNRKRNAALTFSVFSFVMALAIVWNRLAINFSDNIVTKSGNQYTIQTFGANLVALPYALTISFLWAAPIVFAILAFIAYKYFKQSRADSWLSGVGRRFLSMSALGVIASMLVYAIAGYSVWGLGMRSRTMTVVSFYLPLVISFLFSSALRAETSYRALAYMKMALLAVFMVCSTVQVFDWAKAWELQKSVIASMPNEKIFATDKDALIMIDGEFKHEWVSVFDADYAINAQMNAGPVMLGISNASLQGIPQRNFCIGRALVHPIKNDIYKNDWRNDTLFGYYASVVADNSLKTSYYTRTKETYGSELYLWDTRTNEFKKMPDSCTIALTPFENYDKWLTDIWSRIKK